MVILEAPTGTGKTLIGEMVRRIISYRTLYVCTDKELQRQFVKDFPYAHEIKGRDNYPTQRGPHWVTCGDCTWPGPDENDPQCQWCEHKTVCPYEIVKQKALDTRTELVVANTAYFLTEANHIGRFSSWDGNRTTETPWGLIVMDEADTLEAQVMGHVEFRLSKRTVDSLRIDPPDRVTFKREGTTIMQRGDAWTRWAAEEGLPKLRRAVNDARRQAERSEAVRDMRVYRSLNRQLGQLERIKDDVSEGWVYTGGDQGEIAFKPVTVSDQGNDTVWKHAPRWLLMSATVVSAAQMAEDLGLGPSEWASVSVDSGFDATRRPVIIDSKAVAMSNRTKSEAWPATAERIKVVLEKYPTERVLIHTVSYRLANYLAEQLEQLARPILIYRMAKERTAILEDFRSLAGSVLIAPSLERGIDLPDDLARVVIVAKVPFGNLGDKQIAARMRTPGGQSWYAVQAIRSLIQMTGRGMRHKDDYCDIWITDRNFIDRIWKPHRGLLPGWWRSAIVWHADQLPPLDERLEGLNGD